LFFNDEDCISIHTVTSAVHGVIRDLAKKRGINKSIKDSPLIADESRKKYQRAFNLPQNYFKHADKDPNLKMLFRYNLTPFYIFDAIVLYVALDKSITHEMKIFCMWFQLRFPDLFCYQSAEEHLSHIRESTSDPEAFKALAKVLLSKKDE
jgi:hypothetical protein